MNVQEQIEKAWKAGFECAMANAYDENGDDIYSLTEGEFLEALNEYINSKALANGSR